jgi:hypothetical protein
MNEGEIIRLNVERFRRMLRTEADESARRAIQQILMEFEAKLSAAPLTKSAAQLDPHHSRSRRTFASLPIGKPILRYGLTDGKQSQSREIKCQKSS